MVRRWDRRDALRAGVVAIATLASATAGCGGEQAAAPTHSAQATTATPTTPTTLSPAERDAQAAKLHRRMLRRHDLPPEGVRRQVDYFQEGGPPSCTSEPRDQRVITFGRGMLRTGKPQDWSPRGIARPEQGEGFVMCVGGMDDSRPVLATMRGPGGTVRQTRLPAAAAFWYTSFDDRAPLGRYVVDASQGTLHVRGSFTLRPPAQPEYHVVPRGMHPRVLDVVLLGLRPHEQAELLFYRVLPYRPGHMLKAGYVTSAPLRAGTDGVGTYPIDVGPVGAVGMRCEGYVVKARVRGRLLEDLNNTISSFPVCARR